jgi:hypothetical protein
MKAKSGQVDTISSVTNAVGGKVAAWNHPSAITEKGNPAA